MGKIKKIINSRKYTKASVINLYGEKFNFLPENEKTKLPMYIKDFYIYRFKVLGLYINKKTNFEGFGFLNHPPLYHLFETGWEHIAKIRWVWNI